MRNEKEMDFNTYLDEHSTGLKHVYRDIEPFIDGLVQQKNRGGTLWILGNGGSASSASHAVADLVKTAAANGGKGLKAAALSEFISLNTALANDESFELGFSRALEMLAGPLDAIMIISVSGMSPNLVSAAKTASAMSIPIFSLLGQRGSKLASESHHSIIIPSDDYQIVENAHMMLIHWFVKKLWDVN